MRNLVLVCMLGAFLGVTARASAQGDPPAKSRQFCDVKDAKNKCTPPSPNCVCSEDTMAITFDRDGINDSVFIYDPFVQDAPVLITVAMDVKSGGPDPSDGVQGWSYGIDHDEQFLTLDITSLTVDGTDAERAKTGGFIVADGKDIQTCKDDPDPKCKTPKAGTGFISAIILNLTQAAER